MQDEGEPGVIRASVGEARRDAGGAGIPRADGLTPPGETEAGAGRCGARPLAELSSAELGVRGEQAAARYLAAHGWEIVERNWRCPLGEVDIVAHDAEGATVLVEVKTRRQFEAGEVTPEEAVDRRKRRRYRALAAAYLSEHLDVSLIRFDVIALAVREGGSARVRHIVNAFGGDD